MNFSMIWRRKIFDRLSSATTSMLVNESHTNQDIALLQGVHLSPFCFLIAAKGLKYLIDSSIRMNSKGIMWGMTRILEGYFNH